VAARPAFELADVFRRHGESPFVVYAKPPFGGPERVRAYLGPLHPSDRHRQFQAHGRRR
jgi:hypothetical protein